MENIDLSRKTGRKRVFLRLGIGFCVLVVGAYFAISTFGSSDASHTSLDTEVGADLSLARSGDSVSGFQSSVTGTSGTSSNGVMYASPSQMNDVVPRRNSAVETFKQHKTLEFATHSVRPGENLWTIARSYNRSIHTIVSANQSVLNEHSYLPKDLTLKIPNRDGIMVQLKPGQTLWDLMRSYDVDYRKIVSFNELDSASSVSPGQKLFIPGAQPLNTFKFNPNYFVSEGFSWPVTPGDRRLTSRFGDRFHPKLNEEIFHRGIDIGAPRGTAIFAAKPGEVVYAQRYGDYGNTVVIRHANGHNTLYAHLSRIIVEKGQFVERGQPIAFMGDSGLTTGVNLHFEVRKNDKVFNPVKYLPNVNPTGS